MRKIFHLPLIVIFVLGLTTLAYAKLPPGPLKFIMSTGEKASTEEQALKLLELNKTAIINKLSSDIKTLWIEHAEDPVNGKTYSQVGVKEVEFLFDRAWIFPLNRSQFRVDVRGTGRLFLANIPMIRKGTSYKLINKKIILRIERNVPTTNMIATGVGTEVKKGETYFKDLKIRASEFRILITEEGDLYSWY